MKIIIIEHFTATPHFETSIEIAMQENKKGNNVEYTFLNFFYDILRTPGHLRLSIFKNYLWLRKDNRHKISILNKLKAYGIKLIVISSVGNPFVFLRCLFYSVFHPLSLESIKKYKYKNNNLGLGVLSAYISRLGNDEPTISWKLIMLKKLFFESAYTFEITNKIIKLNKPDLIYTFNGRYNIDCAIINAAKKSKIKVLVHERGATYKQYEIFDFPLHSYKNISNNILKYWDNSSELNTVKIDIANSFYTKNRNGVSIGWESFSKNFENKIELKENHRMKYVFYVSSDDELAYIDFDEDEKQPLFDTQKEAISFLIDWVAKQESIDLYIRVHPNISNKSIELQRYWNSLKGKNIVLFESYSSVNSYLLLDKADCVITYNTTMGIEASYWNKPSILLGLSWYRNLNCTYNPINKRELLELLNTPFLAPFDSSKCLYYGYYFSTFGIGYEYYKPISLFEGELLI